MKKSSQIINFMTRKIIFVMIFRHCIIVAIIYNNLNDVQANVFLDHSKFKISESPYSKIAKVETL